MKAHYGYAALSVVAAVVGCSSIPSVGPDYEEPELKAPDYQVPDAGLATTNLTETGEFRVANSNEDSRITISKDVLERWWMRFDDPVLVSLIEGGVSNNIGYVMAQKNLEASNWRYFGSFAAFMPKFAVGAAWSRNWASVNNAGRMTYNVEKLPLQGDWEIDIFGGNRRLCESALAAAEAAGWTVADAWVSLTTQIGSEYIALRTTQELIDVARTNLLLQSETYDILKSRLESGIGDELAVNQCAYIVSQTRANIPTLLAMEERSKNRLTILAGEMPGALHDLLKAVSEPRDWLLSPQKVGELKLDMMRARPDVKAAERNLAAQTARIGVAKAAWFPRLYITGTVGWETHKSASLFSKDSFIASLGPSASWPIFQGGAIYANVKATEAETDAAAMAYEQAIENAYADVRNAYADYTQEYHRYESLKTAVKAATDAVTISQDLYRNGLRDFNNVLEAQRSRLQLEEAFVTSRGKISQNLISLYRALGGGLASEGQF